MPLTLACYSLRTWSSDMNIYIFMFYSNQSLIIDTEHKQIYIEHLKHKLLHP